METIQINKKPSNRLRMLLTLGILAISTLILSYFIYHSYQKTSGTFNINENTVIVLLICVIVIFPLLLFILPNSPGKQIQKTAFTKKRELVTKRKRKSVYMPLNGKQQSKLY